MTWPALDLKAGHRPSGSAAFDPKKCDGPRGARTGRQLSRNFKWPICGDATRCWLLFVAACALASCLPTPMAAPEPCETFTFGKELSQKGAENAKCYFDIMAKSVNDLRDPNLPAFRVNCTDARLELFAGDVKSKRLCCESARTILGCGFLHKLGDADLSNLFEVLDSGRFKFHTTLRPHLNDSGHFTCSFQINGKKVVPLPEVSKSFVSSDVMHQIGLQTKSFDAPTFAPKLRYDSPYKIGYVEGAAFIMDKERTVVIATFDVNKDDPNVAAVIEKNVQEYMPAIHTINSLHKRFGEHIKMPAVTVKGNTVRYYDLAWFRSPDEKYPAIEVPATTGPLQDSPTLKLWDKLLPKLFNGSALKSRPDATLTNPEFFTLLPIFDIANIHALSPPVLEEAVASRTRDELVSYFERCNELCQLNVGVSPKSWNRFQPSPIISVDEKGEGFTVAHHKLDRKVAFTLKELAPVYEPLVSNAYGMDYFLVKS
eukprot:GHVT01085397.1.p1 GENE.GHVT01085397.1~~GHVT01085397.1.p1  ORF type:complete len:485 (-),score=48.68 GHVT01085397.1:504-1958(-)